MSYVKPFFYQIAKMFLFFHIACFSGSALGQEQGESSPKVSSVKKNKKRRPKLRPAQRKIMKAASSGFKQCQKDNFRLLKAKKINSKQFKRQLTACKERFPGASLYINCKKKVLKSFGRSKKAKTKLKKCKKLLLAATFDKKSANPFFIKKERLYFAGIGFNKSQKMKTFEAPNFDCSSLKAAVQQPEKAEHILFGNHPSWFSKLRGKSHKTIKKLLKTSKNQTDENGMAVKGLGRIYGDPTADESLLFFPSSSCSYSGELGEFYNGLSAYYLIDHIKKAVTPYFTIAFYKPGIAESKQLTTELLINKIKESLGSHYSTIRQSKQHHVLAAAPIKSFDEESDPQNICKLPREHDLVAIVKSRSDATNTPEFVLIANVKALCKYGDRMSRRL